MDTPVDSTARQLGALCGARHGLSRSRVESCLRSRCLEAVQRALTDTPTNACNAARIMRRSKKACGGVKSDAREASRPWCVSQCERYRGEQKGDLDMDSCVANCTFYRASRDPKYTSCMERATSEIGAQCVLAKHEEALMRCMREKCDLGPAKGVAASARQ
mmetsp:Transcript_23150/g.74475  ORF Transcript_23150/g.74475 Transcript_23150/m.74475 type:complete len:161 (+) Transcript_23150:2-484(+)